MLKKLLVGIAKPRIEYLPLEGKLPEPFNISIPPQVTLLLNSSPDSDTAVLLKKGDAVKTGQKLSLTEDSDVYAISPVTGTIAAITSFIGDFGRTGTAISIDTAQEDDMDDQFANSCKEPSLDSAAGFLAGVPGNPNFAAFSNDNNSIDTIVINAADKDLLIATNQFLIQTKIAAISKGIAILKKITGIDDIILVVPENIMPGYGDIGAEVKSIRTEYPAALPHMILKDVLGQVIPAGKSWEDIGVAIFSAEAMVSIGRAYEEGRIPVSKLLTVVKKDGSKGLVSTRIGTPIKEIMKVLGESINAKDRIILGGPMTGTSVYAEDHPVEADTDAIFIQDKDNIPYISDYACINCGECIRICPAKIPINMLVRLLEAGHYQEAAEQYDLYSCFECGLCSYVCVSRIPIFQYIRLAKYELARTDTAEATHV